MAREVVLQLRRTERPTTVEPRRTRRARRVGARPVNAPSSPINAGGRNLNTSSPRAIEDDLAFGQQIKNVFGRLAHVEQPIAVVDAA